MHYISSQVFLATTLFHIILLKWLFWYLIFRRTMLVTCFSGITFRGRKAENFIIKILTLWYIWNNVSLSYILVPGKSSRGKKQTNKQIQATVLTETNYSRPSISLGYGYQNPWLLKSYIKWNMQYNKYYMQDSLRALLLLR